MWRPWSLPNLQMYMTINYFLIIHRRILVYYNNKYINKQSINCSHFGNIFIRTTLVCNFSYMQMSKVHIKVHGSQS